MMQQATVRNEQEGGERTIDTTNVFERHPVRTIAILVLLMTVIVDLILGTLFIPATAGIPSPYYHHDLKHEYRGTVRWGNERVPYTTNQYGFKDASVRQVAATTTQRRILFIGDSFTEGVGVPYAETFVGRSAAALQPRGVEVLNAGVASYSPTLYEAKVRYLLAQGLRFDELFVFIDASDVADELTYASFTPMPWYDPRNLVQQVDAIFKQHSIVYGYVLRDAALAAATTIKSRGTESRAASLKTYYDERTRWSYDDEVYERWGRTGMRLAQEHMLKLQQVCDREGIRLSIAVYPWPEHIRRHDTESRQRRAWEAFAREYNIPFLDLFSAFIPLSTNPADAETVIAQEFFAGDVHWNSAGHARVAREWLRWYDAR